MTALQKVEVTVRWHNIWLGTTVLLFISTAVFAGLFGGYFAAYQESKSKACFLEMHYWKHFELLDPSIHSVALLNGTYYAVPDHTVTKDSCLLKFSKSLQTHNVILPHSTGAGRALQETKCNECKNKNNQRLNQMCIQECTATAATKNTNGECTCNGGGCVQDAICTKSCICDGGLCDQSKCPSTATISCKGGKCTQNGKDCNCDGGNCYNCFVQIWNGKSYTRENTGQCPVTDCMPGEPQSQIVNQMCSHVCALGIS